MSEFLIAHEGAVRLGFFAGVLLVMLAWEHAAPRRAREITGMRGIANWGLVVLDAVVLRLLLPAAAIGVAMLAQRQGFGLFNRFSTPDWLAVLASIVLLDFAVWAQHLAMHKFGMLWRLHRVHHSDLAFDVSTGVRFHPFEILLSMLYKMAIVLLLGAPALAVLVFELLLSASSLFTHGNVCLSPPADRLLRRVIVTPEMHRVHHSILCEETDSNFGFALALWDRLFGTYCAEPRIGHTQMLIGLSEFRDRREQRLDCLLLQPLLVGELPRQANTTSTEGRNA